MHLPPDFLQVGAVSLQNRPHRIALCCREVQPLAQEANHPIGSRRPSTSGRPAARPRPVGPHPHCPPEQPAGRECREQRRDRPETRFLEDRKSTRLNSSHVRISYAVFCLKKKKNRNSASDITP